MHIYFSFKKKMFSNKNKNWQLTGGLLSRGQLSGGAIVLVPMLSNLIFSISTLNCSSCTDSNCYCFFINMARVTVVLVDDFAFLGPQGVLQVGNIVSVLLLSMSVVLGDCCPTSLIFRGRI